jgi:uncharacterized protein
VTDAPSPIARLVQCPACGKATAFTAANRFRPFCGERCKATDLGAWATESYRIAAQPGEDELPDAAKDSET